MSKTANFDTLSIKIFYLYNWGEPKQAPHKSYIQENRCTYVCVCVCMQVSTYAAIHRPRGHSACVRNRCGKDHQH